MFPMNDLCHPSYYKISQLGCNDGMKITTAFYVYMELCEVKRLWDVEYKYNKEIDLIYLEGKKRKSSVPEIYVPWPVVYKISLVQIESIQENLKSERFTFVFRGGDSTSVYYRVTSGLIKPLTPDETKLIKQKEEKKFELEQEIRRNTSILYELAKSINSNEDDVSKSEEKNAQENSEAVVNDNEQEKMECTVDKEIKFTKDQEMQSLKDTETQDTQNQQVLKDKEIEVTKDVEIQVVKDKEIKDTNNEEIQIVKEKEIQVAKDEEIQIIKDKEIQVSKDEEIQIIKDEKTRIMKDRKTNSQVISTDVEMIAEITNKTPDIEMLPNT